MTDRRRRERTLPEGYQFGDAGDRRDPHAVAVDASFARNNPSAPCRHQGALRYDATRLAYACACGAFLDEFGWNVIEGEHFASDADRHPVIEGAR